MFSLKYLFFAITTTVTALASAQVPTGYYQVEGDRSAIGDVNRDGRVDVVVGDSRSGHIIFCPGTGTGALAPSPASQVYERPKAINLSDVNVDGKLDLLMATSFALLVCDGLGNGKFAAPDYFPVIAGTGYAGKAIFADYNGDGRMDLAVQNGGQNFGYWVITGQPGGSFSGPVKTASPDGKRAGDISAGDINGDGKADLGVLGLGDNHFYAMISDGNGSFAATPTTLLKTAGAAEVGDVTGDGKADVVLSSNGTQLLVGNGDGTFAPELPISNVPFLDVHLLQDINSDGRLDLVGSNALNLGYALNTGGGTFSNPVVFPFVQTNQTPFDLKAAKLNLNGQLDLVAVTYQGLEVIVR